MFTPLFSLMLAEESSGGGIPWWVWVILIVILLIILYFWFGKDEETAAEETPVKETPVDEPPVEKVLKPVVVAEPETAVAEEVTADVEPEPVAVDPPETPAPTPDDLKKLEGVGPKVASILNEAGITTFQQIVDAGYEKLEGILDAAGLHMIDSDTWPEQSKLAAAGDWEGLKKLQGELKGGKRK